VNVNVPRLSRGFDSPPTGRPYLMTNLPSGCCAWPPCGPGHAIHQLDAARPLAFKRYDAGGKAFFQVGHGDADIIIEFVQ